ncbi:GntR family transcriptional regulator [Mesorhizobium sp. M0590]|uniref:GntR family transcriptional regulator n=1 Tax=Mesorhizobium sp. M0590 TaxID=2956966 RepID=UPI0033377CBD
MRPAGLLSCKKPKKRIISAQIAQCTDIKRWRNSLENGLASALIKPGNRLPSVREMSRQTGYSMATVHHAYSVLESEGVIEA